jgi:enoyl-CoA hydratase
VSDLVSVERAGPVAVVTHDDGKANAYSPDVLAELAAALDDAEADDGVGAVLLRGRPAGAFSAGFDLKVMTASDDSMRSLVAQGARYLGRLFTFGTPVVVACGGHALAAGALVLLAADVRIGADAPARIGLNEVAIGMGLPQFALELARYKLTPKGFDSALLGRTYGPADAVTAGYLDRVVPADELADAALAEATELAALGRGPVRHTKRAARGAIADAFLAGLDADLAGVGRPSDPR